MKRRDEENRAWEKNTEGKIKQKNKRKDTYYSSDQEEISVNLQIFEFPVKYDINRMFS